MITVPFHQFEIRFTKILNFNEVINEVIAPFVPMALDIIIEDESLKSLCRYNLIFEGYNILITWDRVLIKLDGELKNLSENNSIIEEPFFNLFSKIRDLKSFGNVVNCLCVAVIVNHSGKTKTEILNDFSTRFLNMNNVEKIIYKPSDVGLTLNENNDGKQITLTFGPYIGVTDLQNRKIMTQNQEILKHIDILGEMVEIKIFEILKSVSFAKYKELLKMIIEYQRLLWKM